MNEPNTLLLMLNNGIKVKVQRHYYEKSSSINFTSMQQNKHPDTLTLHNNFQVFHSHADVHVLKESIMIMENTFQSNIMTIIKFIKLYLSNLNC